MLQIERYIRAETPAQAYELCQKKSNVILGGMLWLKQQNRRVSTAVDLCGLGLDKIEETEDSIRIGAMVSLRDMETHPALNALCGGAIADSLCRIVGVQFRNLATVGGSVFGRFGFSDVLTVLMALDAAKELEAKGIDAEVLDLRSLVPLDWDAISESVTKTGRVIICHEAVERGGYGAEVAAQIADKLFDELDAPIVRVCGVNIPVPNATQPELESAPTVKKLVEAATRICKGGARNG